MAHIPHNTRQLPRVLRFFDISVLASASMGPAYSLASTLGPMVAAAGSATPVALLSLSAIMLCMAIAFARLVRVAPNAGSSYSWIRMAFGARAGAYGAWLLILSNFFATMATAVPAGYYTLALLAPAHAQNPLAAALVGAVWIVASAILLYAGIRPTALVTAVALLAELAVLGASALAAALLPHAAHVTAATKPTAIPLTWFGFATAMTLGVWMSDGWEISASTSEETAGASNEAGRGGVVGLLVTTVVLLACVAAYLHLGSPAGFAQHQSDSLAYVGDMLGGGAWRIAIVSTVLVSTCATLWTTLLYLSRSIYAMGRDALLPRALGTLDRRNEPLVALAVVALLVTVCEIFTGFSQSANEQLTIVLDASSVFLGALFVGSAAACVRTFWRDGNKLTGVVVPAIGGVALAAVLIATIVTAETKPRTYAWIGLAVGIPFALWRGGRAQQG